MIRRSIALVALLGVTASESVTADEIRRRALPDFPISSSVEVPGGRTLVFLSGTVPDVADPDAAPGHHRALRRHRQAGGTGSPERWRPACLPGPQIGRASW